MRVVCGTFLAVSRTYAYPFYTPIVPIAGAGAVAAASAAPSADEGDVIGGLGRCFWLGVFPLVAGFDTSCRHSHRRSLYLEYM